MLEEGNRVQRLKQVGWAEGERAERRGGEGEGKGN